MPPGMAGRFISFEGIDGSGKSTQARRLAETLRAAGAGVVLTREPGGSPGAEEIRRLVLEGKTDRWSAETEILLFTAARRDHLERTIAPALAKMSRDASAICCTAEPMESARNPPASVRCDCAPFSVIRRSPPGEATTWLRTSPSGSNTSTIGDFSVSNSVV